MISESRSKVILNLHIAARPYYSSMGSSFYPSYYPVFPPPSQADYYLPNQQQGDESSALFRSGSEPRFFGLKKASLSGLISALRGPPGIAFLTLFLCSYVESIHHNDFLPKALQVLQPQPQGPLRLQAQLQPQLVFRVLQVLLAQ